MTAAGSARPRLGVSSPLALIFQVGRGAIHRRGQMEVPGAQRTRVRTAVRAAPEQREVLLRWWGSHAGAARPVVTWRLVDRCL